MQQSVTRRNHKSAKSQTQFKSAEHRFVIFLEYVMSELITPLKATYSKLNISNNQMSRLNLIFDAISNLYEFHATALSQLSCDLNVQPAIFRHYALFPSIYETYFDSAIVSLPHLSNIFCISHTNVKKWAASKCNAIRWLYDTTNTISYKSFAEILRDIFIHCIEQSHKLKKIAASKDFNTNIDAQSFTQNTRIHLKNTLLKQWDTEYRQQFDLLHLEMILTQTNIQLYHNQRRLMLQFEIQISTKYNKTRQGILYVFNDSVLITTKSDKYKGLYDLKDDKVSFVQGEDQKSITFSRHINDKKKRTIVLGKTECKMAFDTINDYKNQLKPNVGGASQSQTHSFSTIYDMSEVTLTANSSFLPTPLPETIEGFSPLSYKDNIPIYDEADILTKADLVNLSEDSTQKKQPLPRIDILSDCDTDGSEEDRDFKMKMLLKPNWANNDDELPEYKQLSADDYAAAHREVLDKIRYSENMHIHNLFKSDSAQNKMLQHPFEMFLDEVDQNEDAMDDGSNELNPEFVDAFSLSTLGPSASLVAANINSDDKVAAADGAGVEWKVAPPTQEILDQFNLQTNNNLLLKEIQRLREIVGENVEEMKSVKEENVQLKRENMRLKLNNDTLNTLNWSKSADDSAKNGKHIAVAQANRLRKRKKKCKSAKKYRHDSKKKGVAKQYGYESKMMPYALFCDVMDDERNKNMAKY